MMLLVFVALPSMNTNLCQHRDGVSAMAVSEILRSQKTHESKKGWSVRRGGVRNGSVSDGGAGPHC